MDLSRPHIPHHSQVLWLLVRMKHHMRAIDIDIQATRAEQRSIIVAGHQERTRRPLVVRPSVRDPFRADRVARIVLAPHVAVTAEEQDIHPAMERRTISYAHQTRRLDQGPVCFCLDEDLYRVANWRDAVARGDLLQHDGRGHNGSDAVAAIAAVPDAVAVDLVDDVLRAIVVGEAGRIDGAALGEVAGDGFGFGSVRTFDGVAGGGADTVVCGVDGRVGCVVEHEGAGVLWGVC